MRLASAEYLSPCMERLAIDLVCTELQNRELESWSHLCKATDGRQLHLHGTCMLSGYESGKGIS